MGKVNIICYLTSISEKDFRKKLNKNVLLLITEKHVKCMPRYMCSKLAQIQDSRWHWQHASVKTAALNWYKIDHIACLIFNVKL